MNTNPIYSRVGDAQWAVNITAANDTIDLTSGTSYLVWTADATNGGYARELRLKANPSQNTAATVLRVWLNNGAALGTDSNSVLLDELGIPATTASPTQPTPTFVLPLNFAVPPGYRIYVTVGTAPGGSGEFMAVVVGGKY